MKPLFLNKDVIEIKSVEDWFRLAPPKDGVKQWKDGRSAKELAKMWFPSPGVPRAPGDLLSLLGSVSDLTGIQIVEGIPEHKIPLDKFRGEGRNADLVLLGYRGDAKTSINIEAKADEPFDQRIGDKLENIKNPRSKLPERIDLLCMSLFGQTPSENPELLDLRYQLLTGCAGTLIEAARVGANTAVFVVHVFLSNLVKDENIRSNDEDYKMFLKCLCKDDLDPKPEGQLTGPIMVNGGPFVPSEIPLYIGKIKTEVGPEGRPS